MHVTGTCLCGQITYAAEIDPERVAICHCTDCQVHSGAAYGVVAGITGGQFQLLTGELKLYTKTAASGRTRVLSFCPECGTRIHAHTPNDPSAFFGLRVGTITQRAALVPKMQVWCQSALPWTRDLGTISSHQTQRR